MPQRFKALLPCCFFLDRIAVLFGYHIAKHHQAESHQDSRHDTSEKQLADAVAGQGCINNKCNTRRNDRPQNGGAGRYCNRITPVVSFFLHGRDQHASDRSRRCRGRTGHARKQHACEDCYMSQTACNMPDPFGCELHNTFRDAAAIHKFPGQHKERDRKQ